MVNREEQIQELTRTAFDVCIIGGGVSGAGCALDASLRGLRVALIDKGDFAAETSSRSTKLLHGGVRYLEQAFKKGDYKQLNQVKHGLKERHRLLRNAPHLSSPLPILTPVRNLPEAIYYRVGLAIYDWFASREDRLPGSRWISRRAALQLVPTLSPRFHSAVLYYDGQLNDARYNLAIVQSALSAGAVAVNYLEATGFSYDEEGKLATVHAVDRIAEKKICIVSKVFLNCTGAQADIIRRMANPSSTARVQPSEGVHLALPASVLSSKAALLIPKTPDGRVVFALPYEGYTLLGTTDVAKEGAPGESTPDRQDTAYLLDTLQPYVSVNLSEVPVRGGFGGYRPLVKPAKTGVKDSKRMLRDHEVETDAPSGLISLLGGKWTTYRLMASDATDAVCRRLGRTAPCETAAHALFGAHGYRAHYTHPLIDDPEISRHLTHYYGDQADAVVALTEKAPALLERLHPAHPFIRAEVIYGATVEMAQTLRDVMARRLGLELLDWGHAAEMLEAVATLMGGVLGWSEKKTVEEVAQYRQLLDRIRRRQQGYQGHD